MIWRELVVAALAARWRRTRALFGAAPPPPDAPGPGTATIAASMIDPAGAGGKQTSGPITKGSQGGPSLGRGDTGPGDVWVTLENRHTVLWVGESSISRLVFDDDGMREFLRTIYEAVGNTWYPNRLLLGDARRVHIVPVSAALDATAPWGGIGAWRRPGPRSALRKRVILSIDLEVGTPRRVALPGLCYACPHEVLYGPSPGRFDCELEAQGYPDLSGATVADHWQTVIDRAWGGKKFNPPESLYEWSHAWCARPEIITPGPATSIRSVQAIYRAVSVDADYGGLGVDAVFNTIGKLRDLISG